MERPVPDAGVLARKSRLVEKLLDVLPQDAVIHDERETHAYECDALTAYKCPPMVAVLPSSTQEVADVLKICHAEGVPVVLMEAMASGLPVVTTRIAGVPELVQDGVSGLLVPPGDADALADALTKVLDDPDTATAMGQQGRKKVVADFSATTEAMRLGHLIETYHQGRASPLRPQADPC